MTDWNNNKLYERVFIMPRGAHRSVLEAEQRIGKTLLEGDET